MYEPHHVANANVKYVETNLENHIITHYPVDDLAQASWRSDQQAIKSDFYGGSIGGGNNNHTNDFVNNNNHNSKNHSFINNHHYNGSTINTSSNNQYNNGARDYSTHSSRAGSANSSGSASSSSTVTTNRSQANLSSIHQGNNNNNINNNNNNHLNGSQCDINGMLTLRSQHRNINHQNNYHHNGVDPDRFSYSDNMSISSGPALHSYYSDCPSTSSTLDRRQLNSLGAHNNMNDAGDARMCITDLGSLDNISSVFDQLSIQSDFATASYRCYDPPSIQPIVVGPAKKMMVRNAYSAKPSVPPPPPPPYCNTAPPVSLPDGSNGSNQCLPSVTSASSMVSQLSSATLRAPSNQQQLAQRQQLANALRQQLASSQQHKPVIPHQFDYPTTSLERIQRYRRSTRLTRTSSMFASPKSTSSSSQHHPAAYHANSYHAANGQYPLDMTKTASVLSKPRVPSLILPPERPVRATLDTRSLTIPPPTPYRSADTNSCTGLYNIPSGRVSMFPATPTNGQMRKAPINKQEQQGIGGGLSRLTSATKIKTVQQLSNIKRLFTSSRRQLNSRKSLFDSSADLNRSTRQTTPPNKSCLESPPNQGSRASIDSADANDDSDTTLVSANGIAVANNTNSDAESRLLARIEELDAQVRSKDKDITNLRLENMTAAYSTENLRSEVNKLVRENLQLKLKVEELTEAIKMYQDKGQQPSLQQQQLQSQQQEHKQSENQQQNQPTIGKPDNGANPDNGTPNANNNGNKIADNYARLFNFSSVQ